MYPVEQVTAPQPAIEVHGAPATEYPAGIVPIELQVVTALHVCVHLSTTQVGVPVKSLLHEQTPSGEEFAGQATALQV